MKLIEIKGTKGYQKLSHLPFNRNYTVRKSLTDSMNKYGFIDPIKLIKTSLITGKEETYILDGQNRACAAQYLDITFYGVLIEHQCKSLQELVALVSAYNNTQISWGVVNYCNAYASIGLEPYKYILRQSQSTGFSVNTLGVLYSSTMSAKANSVNNGIKNGKLKLVNIELVNESLDYSRVLAKYKKFTSRMIIALYKVMIQTKKFNKTDFENNFKHNVKKMNEYSLDDYTEIFKSFC